jgi:hypothetical protein
MAWWWAESRAETGCRLTNLFAKSVLVVTENFYRYHDCFTNGDASQKVQRYLVATVIRTQSLSSQICIYIYIYVYIYCIYIYIYICIYIHTHTRILHNMETLVGKKKFKKWGQRWTPCAKEICPCAILGTRAIDSPVSQSVVGVPIPIYQQLFTSMRP